MVWVAIVLVIIAAFAVPRLGKALLGLAGILLVLGVVGAAVIFVTNRRQKAERELAKTRIKAGELDLVDLRLRNSYSTGSYTLVGRVRNRSGRYTLREVRLRLTMRDCFEVNDCEVVGQTEEAIYANVPPGQARDLDEFVSFSGLGSPRGKHQWDYQITEIIGQQD